MESLRPQRLAAVINFFRNITSLHRVEFSALCIRDTVNACALTILFSERFPRDGKLSANPFPSANFPLMKISPTRSRCTEIVRALRKAQLR